jgi:hypothetical protein
MRIVSTRTFYASISVMFIACTPEPATVSEWLGPGLHGQMRGEIEAERVDVVAEADGVACQRKYGVPDPNDPSTFADGGLQALLVSFMVKSDGLERWYELEFSNHDFNATALGTVLTVVPEPSAEAEIGEDEVNVELRWEWEQGNDLIRYGEPATGGTLELRELSGTPGADGLVVPADDGNFGGFLQLELPSGSVAVSFTAPCTAVEVESI